MIPVTKPFLPPKEEYNHLLEEIWQRNWLTNNGPIVQKFEKKLMDYLGVSNLKFVSNGTIALQIAIKALKLEGEIITTPFSYVATTSSIVWEDCTPVFVDIHPKSLNIDPQQIEKLVNDRTSAILATHVYGNPCDIENIQDVADKYDLKVIYDAAHCFGVKYKQKSIFQYGDISTASFHATKPFHTVEGGAVASRSDKINKRVHHMRNFGHAGPYKFDGLGINGKNSEFHAAMGLVNLDYADEIIKRREKLSQVYDNYLQGINIKKPLIQGNTVYNYAYYPIIIKSESELKKIISVLEGNNIESRRYFYPLLSELNYVEKDSTPVAEDLSKRILCLPLYHTLQPTEIEYISNLIKQVLI